MPLQGRQACIRTNVLRTAIQWIRFRTRRPAPSIGTWRSAPRNGSHAGSPRYSVLYGTAGAILLRVTLIAFALTLLAIPCLKLVGGLLLIGIGVKLLVPQQAHDGGRLAVSGGRRRQPPASARQNRIVTEGALLAPSPWYTASMLLPSGSITKAA